MSDQDISKLKVAELREMLKLKGLNSVGNKQELIERLQTAMSESSGELNEDDLLNDDELEEEKSLLDSTHDSILKSPESVKSISPETHQPAKKISLKRNISITVPIIETKAQEDIEQESPPTTDEPEKKVVKISELTAKDRLELRAKKFSGTESSTVGNSQDKLQARAARFGTTITTEKSADKPSGTSLEVLKKRAERFGTVLVPELKKCEMEEKLQKRQERFGSEKIAITAPTTGDSDYKEKALKRLERFKVAT